MNKIYEQKQAMLARPGRGEEAKASNGNLSSELQAHLLTLRAKRSSSMLATGGSEARTWVENGKILPRSERKGVVGLEDEATGD